MMLHNNKWWALCLAIIQVDIAGAMWKIDCLQPVVSERIDPVIQPGVVSGHVHTVMGGNGIGFAMDYASTQASTCSSCNITGDLSNYWVPALYFHAQNGSFINVPQSGGMAVYYDAVNDSGTIQAFPEGFRMAAGNPSIRSFSDTNAQKAVTYSCVGTEHEFTYGFPMINCPRGLRAQVITPSCWNGQISTPFYTEMAYPSNLENGSCPEDFPYRLMTLKSQTIWDTQNFGDMWWNSTGQPFVWSYGDPLGYGYHVIFENGWDIPLLQSAIDKCDGAIDPSGNVPECSVFMYPTEEHVTGCKTPVLVHEQTTGVLNKLAGCNPVQYGPVPAIIDCDDTTSIGPEPILPFIDFNTINIDWKYVGCGTDSETLGRTLDGASYSDGESMTIEYCVKNFCTPRGYNYAGLEDSNQCYCGHSILDGRAPIAGIMGDCSSPCSGNSNETCGGASLISLYQKCETGQQCVNNVPYYNSGTGISSNGSALITPISTPSIPNHFSSSSSTLLVHSQSSSPANNSYASSYTFRDTPSSVIVTSKSYASNKTTSVTRSYTDASIASLATAHPTPVHCNYDNCLRGLIRHSASAFCTSLTASFVQSTEIAHFPSFATWGLSRLSSACTCLMVATSTSTTSPTMTAGPKHPAAIQ